MFEFDFRKSVSLIAVCVGVGIASYSSVSAQISPSPSPSPTPSPTVSPNPTPSPTASPSPSPSPIDTRKFPAGQLLQQASNAGSFTTLAQAIEAAGVGGALQARGGTYTIFAPTDEAFAALPAGTLERLLEPRNRPLLARILAYHVVPGEYTAQTLRSGSLKALGGGLALSVTPQRVVVNNASVVQPNIRSSNAVIHAINRVLIPTDIRKQLGSLK